MLWQNLSDHSQQISADYNLANSKTPQVVTNGRTYTTRPAGAAVGRNAAPPDPNVAPQIAVGGGLGAQI